MTIKMHLSQIYHDGQALYEVVLSESGEDIYPFLEILCEFFQKRSCTDEEIHGALNTIKLICLEPEAKEELK